MSPVITATEVDLIQRVRQHGADIRATLEAIEQARSAEVDRLFQPEVATAMGAAAHAQRLEEIEADADRIEKVRKNLETALAGLLTVVVFPVPV